MSKGVHVAHNKLEANLQDQHSQGGHGAIPLSAGMLLVTLGVVYGDIGTSPMYTMKSIVANNGGIGTVSEDMILDALSLVIWTMTLVTTVKYVLIAMKADNHNEGGIFTLFSLVRKVAPWLILPAMIGGAALDSGGDDLAGAAVGLVLVLSLDLLDHERLLMHDVVLQAVDEEGLGLLDRIAGDLLEQLHLGLLELIDLVLLGVDRGDLLVERVRLFVERVRFAVERLFLLLEAALLLLQLRPALLDLALVLRPALVDLFLGLEQGLAPLALGTLIGVIYDLLGLLLRAADLAFRDLFAVKPAKDATNHKRCDDTTECYW